MFQELNFGAGICKDMTQLSAKARWFDGNFVRFRDGLPECIGGWSALPYADIPLNFNGGVPRAIKQWTALDSTPLVAIGTSSGLFVVLAGTIYDITPIVEVSTLTNPITTTNGSSIITITDTYTPSVGQAIVMSGATAVGGITAPQLNITTPVLTIVSPTQYTVQANGTATSGATGGGTVTIEYELAPGPTSAGSSGGYGDGPYGAGPYGQTTGSGQTVQPRLWYLDNYGQDLVATVRDAGVYYWSYAGGVSAHAVALSSLGDGNTPEVAKFVQVAPNTQSLIAFGTDVYGGTRGIEDPMMIRWSAPGSATIWTPTVTTPAGFQRLSSGSQIVTAEQTIGQITVITDETAYGMQYVGPPVVYSFTPIGQHINIVAPNVAASLGSTVVWMGYDNFFTYTGNVYPLPCEVRDYVFSNINVQQQYKFFAAVNRRFDEVWWFYVSLNSTEIDSYVMYSFVEEVWSIGMLSRTAWSDEQGDPFPIATDANGVIYAHEYGTDANGAPLTPYVLSSEQSIQQGDRQGMVRRLVPDIFFRGPASSTAQTATIQFLYRDSSDLPFQSSTPWVVTQNGTNYIYPRFRGRNIAVQVSSNSIGTSWRAGTLRADIISDGLR